MTGPWDDFTPAQQDQPGPWDDFAPAPREYPGFKFVPASEEDRAHYEGARGEWVLPEDIGRAAAQRQGDISRIAGREYAGELPGAAKVRSVINGMLLGGEPKVMAAISSPLTGRTYEEEKAIEREKLAREDTAHPYLDPALQFAGGALGLAAAGPERLSAEAIPMVARAVQTTPTLLGRLAATGAARGAPIGAASGLMQRDINSAEDIPLAAAKGAIEGALVGGVAEPLAYGALRGASSFGRYMNNLAFNPAGEAARKLQDVIGKTGIPIQDLAEEIVPQPPHSWAARGITQQHMAEIIARRRAGEAWSVISPDYNVSESQLRSYAKANPGVMETPVNMVDAAKLIAWRKGERGVDEPLTRKIRSSAAQSGETDETAPVAKALLGRQDTQQARVLDYIASAGDGKEFGAEAERLEKLVTEKANAAYDLARANSQKFDVSDILEKWRRNATSSAGHIAKGLNDAVDLFFRPGLNLRNMDPALASRLLSKSYQRRVADPYGRAQARTVMPIQDVDGFLAARDALDDQIQGAIKKDQNALAGRLTKLRTALNERVRVSNQSLAAADAVYAEGKSGQEIMALGRGMPGRLGARADDALAQFKQMTPEQKDLFRVSFLKAMSDKVANERTGSLAVVNKFNTLATRQLIQEIFPKRVAENLINNLSRERATSESLSHIVYGSRTAPLGSDIEADLEKARAGIAFTTGNFGAATNWASKHLARVAMGKQAGQAAQMATETDPVKVLQILSRIHAANQGAPFREDWSRKAALAASLYSAQHPELRP